jgi:hypothetical protein
LSSIAPRRKNRRRFRRAVLPIRLEAGRMRRGLRLSHCAVRNAARPNLARGAWAGLPYRSRRGRARYSTAGEERGGAGSAQTDEVLFRRTVSEASFKNKREDRDQ